ncbi:Rid family hydrolase [Engelhardtia mirabilis]|uniref:Endoribonuclease L-PSP n=1 Tax=Engelhardtia mirabilis TaxID=2528011 RepID=A0A518BFL9_9BACT|nr:Endoribonuclease L-PSP [Planctomycetes bacterium Pla133]QDV00082.1 Endoribonuclease L-PSP [Planctomycetes bacterium Pla86]
MQQVHSGSPFEARYGFCRALRIGDRLEVAGTAPIPAPGKALGATAYDQMLRCGQIAQEALRALAGDSARVLRTRMFITDATDADDIGRAHRELFGDDQPVATMVVVAALLDPAWKVEIEVEAVAG